MDFYSNGKVLLTGEYAVLNGSLSLALPSIYGQYLEVKNNESPRQPVKGPFSLISAAWVQELPPAQ